MNILQIGDSHSVLAYGVELNRLLRSVPGATVTAFASSGSSPMSWVTGYTAKTTAVPPFLMIRPDGSEDLVPPGKERPTPNLGALMATLAPDLVVVSLGANQRWHRARARLRLPTALPPARAHPEDPARWRSPRTRG